MSTPDVSGVTHQNKMNSIIINEVVYTESIQCGASRLVDGSLASICDALRATLFSLSVLKCICNVI